MKAWKFLVLVGGIAGVAGFFLPFFSFASEKDQLVISVSAYQIVSGIDDVNQLVEGAKPMAAANADAKQALVAVNEELEKYRFALVAVFAPAVALALLGALAGVRRRMGRIAGIIAILLGLANVSVWLLFYQVAVDEPGMTATMGFGLHLVLIAGLLGGFAGFGALLAPDRGDVAAD
jgi:hypothetical protein